MTEKYPTWLAGHVKTWEEKRLPTVTLCSTTGNELLEVWYYGDLLTVNGEPQPYIADSDEAPGLVAARDPESGEEFVIFDGGRHGYDNMFCDEHDPAELELDVRPCRQAGLPPLWPWLPPGAFLFAGDRADCDQYHVLGVVRRTKR